LIDLYWINRTLAFRKFFFLLLLAKNTRQSRFFDISNVRNVSAREKKLPREREQ